MYGNEWETAAAAGGRREGWKSDEEKRARETGRARNGNGKEALESGTGNEARSNSVTIGVRIATLVTNDYSVSDKRVAERASQTWKWKSPQVLRSRSRFQTLQSAC